MSPLNNLHLGIQSMLTESNRYKRTGPPLDRKLLDGEVPDGSKIVSMIEHNGQIIMCTETRVYRLDDNGEFVTVKFKKGNK